MTGALKLRIGSDDVCELKYEGLNVAGFIHWVAPTVMLEPFHKEAGLVIDDIVKKNKPNLAPDACRRLLHLLWPSFSGALLSNGKSVSLDEAKSYLREKDRQFISERRPHVVFKHGSNTFVAELDVRAPSADVVQCWRVPSSDIYPDKIIVTFDTVAEKERFDLVAGNLGYNPSDLLLELALDFCAKFQRQPEARDTRVEQASRGARTPRR